MHYNIIVFSISEFRKYYLSIYLEILRDYHLRYDDKESLYDWLVKEGLKNILVIDHSISNIDNHYRHDIYKLVYDHVGLNIEVLISNQIKFHNLYFRKNEIIKTMVCGDTLFLGRGVN